MHLLVRETHSLDETEVEPGSRAERELAELDPSICALERKMFEKVLGRGLRISQCRLDESATEATR